MAATHPASCHRQCCVSPVPKHLSGTMLKGLNSLIALRLTFPWNLISLLQLEHSTNQTVG